MDVNLGGHCSTLLSYCQSLARASHELLVFPFGLMGPRETAGTVLSVFLDLDLGILLELQVQS